MAEEEVPEKETGRCGRMPPPGPDARPDTGSYAHQDLVSMMRRRRNAEEKLRQRQEEATPSGRDDEPH
jgi:hypothetical protein